MPGGQRKKAIEDSPKVSEEEQEEVEEGKSTRRRRNSGKGEKNVSTRKKAKLNRKFERRRRNNSTDQVESSENENTEQIQSSLNSVQEGQEDSTSHVTSNNVTRAEFHEEEGNYFEMRVDASEFPSENEEESSDESEVEEGEQILPDEEFGSVDREQQVAEQPTSREPGRRNAANEFIYVRNPEFQRQGEQNGLTEQEKEERKINKTVAKIQEIMASGNYMRAGEYQVDSEINFNLNAIRSESSRNVRVKGRDKESHETQGARKASEKDSNSEVTLYTRAVQPERSRSPLFKGSVKNSTGDNRTWVGSSDEDNNNLNSSDEIQEQVHLLLNSLRYSGVAENRGGEENERRPREQQEPQPSTSRRHDDRRLTPPAPMIQQRVDTLIRDAENVKARMHDFQGMNIPQNNFQERVNRAGQLDLSQQFVHSAMVDEEYLVVAAHVDENLLKKIRNCEYVDFARLLPRDRVQQETDSRMQILTMQDGKLSCVPSTEGGIVSSFAHWEQAFSVFSNVYTREFPQRASELIEYNHIIHTAAMTYHWNNVYAYDIDF